MPNDVTFKEVDDICAQIDFCRIEIESLENKVKVFREEITRLNAKGMNLLEDIGRSKYESPFGSIEIEKVESVKKPETPEDEELFMEWVKTHGYINKMSMHHGSLNAIYKLEKELAVEKGMDPMDFEVPGIQVPTPFFKLKFKPKKA